MGTHAHSLTSQGREHWLKWKA